MTSRFLLTALFACATLQGCATPIPRSGPAIQTTIVDDVTGQPVAGAIVMIESDDYTPGLIGGSYETGPAPICASLVNFESAISDVDGHVILPAWSHFGRCLDMPFALHGVGIYKPGYEFVILENSTSMPSDPDKLVSEVVKLVSVPHHFDGEKDAQVSHFLLFGGWLRSVTTDYRWGNCFWDQLRPAILMLMQEKRRLSGYIYPQETFFENLTSPGTVALESPCGDLRPKLQPLIKEASATQPETVLSPTIWHAGGYRAEFATAPPAHPGFDQKTIEELEKTGVEHAFQLTDASAFPVYPAIDRKIAEEFGKTGVIYSFRFDPLNIGYVSVSMLIPPVPAVYQEYMSSTGGQYGSRPNWGSKRNLDYSCSSVPQQVLQYMYGQPPKPKDTSAEMHVICQWLAAFRVMPADTRGHIPDQESDPVFYQAMDAWQLDASMLNRPKVDVPEYIEIQGPASLTVKTDLKQVAPRLWQLPARNVDFSMTIGAAQTNPTQ